MSTNSDPDAPDEQQDADAAPDDEDAGTTEQEQEHEQKSTSDTPTADVSSEASDEQAAAESDSDADADSPGDTEADSTAASADEEPSHPPAQFQAAITGGALKTALKTVSTLVDETRIHIDGSGLQMRAVDPANVGMTDLTVDAAAFESYAATAGLLGVDLERLEDIVKMANADDLVQVALDQESGKLVIHIDELEFTMACLDPDTIRAEPDIPDLDLPGEVIVEGDDIDRAVKAADMVSDHIKLGVDPDVEQFYVTARGDTDEVRLELEQEELVDLIPGAAGSLFSLDYLKDMNKAIPTNAEVTLELGEEFPLLLAYEFADGDGHVTQMLAPRIEE